MSDRDRTVFAAIEAVVGAVLVVVGVLLLGMHGFGVALGTAMLALGGVAVVQSVGVGLGLVRMPSERQVEDERDR
jgi:hypothetical protein